MNSTATESSNKHQQNNPGAARKLALRSFLMVLVFALGFYPFSLDRLKSSGAEAPPAVSMKDLPNFHVVDDYFWRGAAPSVEGINELKRLGVKTIIDLRRSELSTSAEGAYANMLGLNYINIPVGNFVPSSKKQKKFFETIKQAASTSAKAPVFVHCSHGSDRTGFLVACWRVQHDQWSIAQALGEMMQYGFFIHKWQPNNSATAQAHPVH